MRYRLSAGPNLPEGYFVNLAAADVLTETGQATRLGKGDVVEATEIHLKERLDDAVKRGDLVIEEIAASPKVKKAADAA